MELYSGLAIDNGINCRGCRAAEGRALAAIECVRSDHRRPLARPGEGHRADKESEPLIDRRRVGACCGDELSDRRHRTLRKRGDRGEEGREGEEGENKSGVERDGGRTEGE